MARESKRERGAAMLEFALAAVPMICFLLAIFEMCLAMWSYHTLATAVEEGARYTSTKGQGCTYTGNSCRVTIGTIVQDILTAGPGIDPSRLALTFHSSATGTTDVTCNPASSCVSSTTAWPPGRVSSGPPAVYGYIPDIDYIDISATYPSPVPITRIFWPGQAVAGIGSLTFSATSRQLIQF